MTKTEELFGSDYAILARKFGEDAAMTAFEKLLKAEEKGKPITRSFLYVIAERAATDEYRESVRERATAERVGNSNSLMREQQGLFSPVETDMRGRDDTGDPYGFRPGDLMGYPTNAIGERTWS